MIAKSSTKRDVPVAEATTAAGEMRLNLYVASSTPNSVRAEANLLGALRALTPTRGYRLEIIDVLADARRAVVDSVIVTPTLVAFGTKRRAVMVGDLSDTTKLEGFLKSAVEVG